MNKNYIIELFDNNRIGLLIKLLIKHAHDWSIDDFEFFRTMACEYNTCCDLYKYMMTLYFKKHVFDFTNYNVDIIYGPCGNIKKTDYDLYAKIPKINYIYSYCERNYSDYDSMRQLNEYFYPYDKYFEYKYCEKIIKFSRSPKMINLNVSKRMTLYDDLIMDKYNSSNILHNALDEDLFDCDNTSLKEIEQYINNNTFRTFNLFRQIEILIDLGRFGHIIKLIKKYESLLNIHTIYIMSEYDILKEYMINHTNIDIIHEIINEKRRHELKNNHTDFYRNLSLKILNTRYINMFDKHTQKNIIMMLINHHNESFYLRQTNNDRYKQFKNNLTEYISNNKTYNNDNKNKIFNTIIDMLNARDFNRYRLYIGRGEFMLGIIDRYSK